MITPQKWFLAGICFAVLIGISGMTSSAGDEIVFYRPGDRDMGRKKFIHFQCTRCHTVFLDSDLPAPIPQFEAPVLGTPENVQNMDKMVEVILGPEHESIVREGPYREINSETGMESYASEIAEQDVIDIVTYLRSTQ